MISAEPLRDIYKVHAYHTPHHLGCNIVTHDGRRMYIARSVRYENVTEVRLYTDTEFRDEAILIRSRSMFDVTLVYDVWDTKAKARIGAIRRVRNRSLLCDEWAVIGCGHNCSPGVKSLECSEYAVMRRALCGTNDHRFNIYIGSEQVGSVCELKSPKGGYFIEADFSGDSESVIDRRLGISAAVLLVIKDWMN